MTEEIDVHFDIVSCLDEDWCQISDDRSLARCNIFSI